MNSTHIARIPRTNLLMDLLGLVPSFARDTRTKISITFRFGFSLTCLAAMLLMAQAVQATSFSSAQSGPWNDSATWGGGGFPAAGDNATINNTHTVTVSGNEAVLNLTVNGGAVLALSGGSVLTVTGTSILNSGTISGSGTFDCQGDLSFVNRASFSAALVVSSSGGSLTRIQNDGSALITFDGTIAVASGATLQIDVNRTLIANSDVTMSSTGTLSGLSNSRLQFNGATLTNNGTVSPPNVDFNRNGAQSIAGTGMWTGSNINIGGSNATNTSLSAAQTFGISGTLTVNGGSTMTVNNPLTVGTANITNGGIIAISSTLSYNPTQGSIRDFLNTGGGVVSGAGTFQAQGDINFVNRGSVSAALVVSSSGGSLTRIQNDGSALITFDGTIAVASGATLQIDVNRTLVANSDVTVSGTGTLSA